MLNRLLPRTFNDVLALILIFMIPGLWCVDGHWNIEIGEQVEGALILSWGIIGQYYFRRKPPDNKDTKP